MCTSRESADEAVSSQKGYKVTCRKLHVGIQAFKVPQIQIPVLQVKPPVPRRRLGSVFTERSKHGTPERVQRTLNFRTAPFPCPGQLSVLRVLLCSSFRSPCVRRSSALSFPPCFNFIP